MTETITFTPGAELRKGFHCLSKGFLLIVVALAKFVNKAVREYPYFVIGLILIASVVSSVVMIGKARAERDSINKTNYKLQQQLDSLQNINEGRRLHGYVYHSN